MWQEQEISLKYRYMYKYFIVFYQIPSICNSGKTYSNFLIIF